MTITEAKLELPAVLVRMPNGTIYQGRVTGRKNPFPTVTISFIHQHHKKHLRDFDGCHWIDFQSTWAQVARVATNNQPINYC